ncbi:MAG: hypothetical protein J0J15_11680 [Mesorhizobium sp.]|nr:hypothetical protein [Mesorhizobium sp.]
MRSPIRLPTTAWRQTAPGLAGCISKAAVVPMRKNVEAFIQSPLGAFRFDGVDIGE